MQRRVIVRITVQMRSEQEISGRKGIQILTRKEQFTGRGLERVIHTEA